MRSRHLREYARLRHARTESRLMKERAEGYASSVQDDAMREAGERARREEEERERERERLRIGRLEDRRAGLLAGLADEPPAGAAAGGTVTIALRFATTGGGSPPTPPGGNVARRRFVAREATVNDVFDWIDAKFGYERERLVLTTMNGSRRFVYVDVDDDNVVDDIEDGGDDDDEDEEEEDEDDEEEEGGDGEGGRGKKIGRPDKKNLTLEEAGFGKMVALRVTEIARDAPSAASEDDEEE